MLDKTFSPASVEETLYSAWEESGLMAAGSKPHAVPYTIMMPPPNITGSLHMGHAFTFTLQDILIRFYRMQERDVLWQPGTDHASISTQMVVERQLNQENLTRHDLGREKFLERVWKWKGESGGAINYQLRRLGASPDWSRERFTMDEGLSAAVRHVFVELHTQGLIYRDKRLVNWDPKLHTAVSDIEVESLPVQGMMYYFNYPLEGQPEKHITIATSRPETVFGDVAVAVHPEDERYHHLIGKFLRHPLTDQLIPIVGDLHADPEKFTGAVKITPAHDFNDFEVGRRHHLPMINVLDKNGCLNENVPPEYHGLDRFIAREKVVEDMTAKGLFEKAEPALISVPHGEKSGVVIEPWLMDQWYVDAATLAQPALKAVEDGKTKFVPQHWENTYFEWLRNIQPWCISRQLWWGHRIPVWYGPDGKTFVALNEEDAHQDAKAFYQKDVTLTQDQDVLDTWFSSALWPFSTLGWPELTPEYKRYYPTDTLITGHDIIFFWVARMMMMGIHFTGEVPFETVYINALVRDEKGQKMSKSKGNVVDPLILLNTYGADTLRFTLASLAAPGRDVKFSQTQVEGYRNFATKLWNAARFAEMNGCVFNPDYTPINLSVPINQWIVQQTLHLSREVKNAIEAYKFNEAAHSLYHFIWGTFCDWYLEFCKPKFFGRGKEKTETQETVAWVLDHLLRFLHPFMPYMTEVLWKNLHPDAGLLMGEEWPQDKHLPYAEASDDIDWLIKVISAVRSVRAEMNVSPATHLNLSFYDAGPTTHRRACTCEDLLLKLARLNPIKVFSETLISEDAKGAAQVVIDEATLLIPLAGAIDIEAEKDRLNKELKKERAEIEGIEKKLGNADFLSRAPQEIVGTQQRRLDTARLAVQKLEQALGRLSGQ
ncbi:MAG: valine--tRNA ligase [Alphaproteobacteria bacterium]|nr:valine--tRNA ligase [Alphaproteobacteria bacterium]